MRRRNTGKQKGHRRSRGRALVALLLSFALFASGAPAALAEETAGADMADPKEATDVFPEQLSGVFPLVQAEEAEQPQIRNLNVTRAAAIEINTAEELAKIGVDAAYPTNGNYVQTADIDLIAYTNWNPIGGTVSPGFTGTYDGQGYAIQNLKISGDLSGNHGVFGVISGSAVLENIIVESGTISGKFNRTGAICGWIANDGSPVIRNCANLGCAVTNTGGEAGGILGWCESKTGTVENCYNWAEISGSGYAGGLLGGSFGTVRNSYAACKSNKGPFTGHNAGTYTNCYYDGNICTETDPKATKSTTAQMQEESFAATMGSAFKYGGVGNYPALTIEAGNAAFKIMSVTQDPKTSATQKRIVAKIVTNDNEITKVFYSRNSEAESGFAMTYDAASAAWVSPLEITKWGTYYVIAYNAANERRVAEVVVTTTQIPISSADELAKIGVDSAYPANADYVQVAAIDLAGISWTSKNLTGGSFDGRGYVIHNLTGQPLFGTVSGTIKNVKLSNVNCTNAQAALVKTTTGTITIENCGVLSGSVTYGSYWVAGILGYVDGAYEASITNCFNFADITGSHDVAGIVGCVWHNGKVEIRNCFNRGKISGSSYSGGILGIHGTGGMDYVTIQNCYNAGAVQNSTSNGAITGQSYGNVTYNVTNNYYDSQTSVVNTSYNTTHATAKTTAEMKSPDMPALLGDQYVYVDGDYPSLAELWVDRLRISSAIIEEDCTISAIVQDFYALGITRVFYADDPAAQTGTPMRATSTTTDGVLYKAAFTGSGETYVIAVDGTGRRYAIKADGYYIVGNAKDFALLASSASLWNRNCVQSADIDLSTITNRASIGAEANPFTGSYNGKGYAITGISGNALFGYATNATFKSMTLFCTGDMYGGNAALLRNAQETLTMEDCSAEISASVYGGGLVNYVTDNSVETTINITRCSVSGSGTVSGVNDGTYTNAGGLFGKIELKNNETRLNLTDCTNKITVVANGSNRTGGGIVGYLLGTHGAKDMEITLQIDNCANMGDISAEAAGGIIGRLNTSSRTVCIMIRRCDNTGTITGKYGGGILGFSDSSSVFVMIELSYNLGNVTEYGSGYAGGIAGYLWGGGHFQTEDGMGSTNRGRISHCYNKGTITASSNGRAGGIVGYMYDKYTHVTSCYSVGITKSNNMYNALVGAAANGLRGSSYDYYTPRTTVQTEVPSATLVSETTMMLTLPSSYYQLVVRDYPILTDNPEPVKDVEKVEIWTAEEFQKIGRDAEYPLNADYVQMADIDFAGASRASTGTSEAPFMGTYDGQGYTITGISGNALFGYTDGAEFQNMTLTCTGNMSGDNAVLANNVQMPFQAENVHVAGISRAYGGGLAGTVTDRNMAAALTITRCSVSGSGEIRGVDDRVSYNHINAGWIAGRIELKNTGSSLAITDCENSVAVNNTGANTNGGGIVGYLIGQKGNTLKIDNAANTGAVTSYKAGGILGMVGTTSNDATLNITRSDNTGAVTATNTSDRPCVGGILGESASSYMTTNLWACYNTGNVTVPEAQGYLGYTGGIAGDLNKGTVSDCYNKGMVTSNDNDSVGGIVGYTYSSSISITGCYSIGPVKSKTVVTGAPLVGTYVSNSVGVYQSYYTPRTLQTSGRGTLVSDGVMMQTLPSGAYELAARNYPILTENPEPVEEMKRVEIWTEEDFLKIGKDAAYPLNADYVQMADIDLAGASRACIGTYEAPFIGTYDGQGYTVAGISGNALFGYTDGAKFQNVSLSCTGNMSGGNAVLANNIQLPFQAEDVHITGLTQAYGGGLIGSVTDGGFAGTLTIARCSVSGTGGVSGLSDGTYTNAGGIVGRIELKSVGNSVKIMDCENNVAVYNTGTGTNGGGVVGYLVGRSGNMFEIDNAANTGVVTSYTAGGILGKVHTTSGALTLNISRSDNTGAITASNGTTGNQRGGGILGESASSYVTANLWACYNTGNVTVQGSSASAGGIAGYLYAGTVSDCYNKSMVKSNQRDQVGGIAGYIGNGEVSACYVTGGISWTGGTVTDAALVGRGSYRVTGGSNYYTPATLQTSSTKASATLVEADVMMQTLPSDAYMLFEGNYPNLIENPENVVDTAGPVIETVTLEPENMVWAASRAVQAQITDDVTGVSRAFASQSADAVSGVGLQRQEDGGWKTADGIGAEGQWYLIAYDYAGNRGEAKAFTVQLIDITAPTIVDVQVRTTGKQRVVTFTAKDLQPGGSAGSGVATIQYAPSADAAEEEWQEAGVSGSGYQFVIPEYDERDYYVRATDNVGNITAPVLAYDNTGLISVSLPLKYMFVVIPDITVSNAGQKFFAQDYTFINNSSLADVSVELTSLAADSKYSGIRLAAESAILTRNDMVLYAQAAEFSPGAFGGITRTALQVGSVSLPMGTLTAQGQSGYNTGTFTFGSKLYPYEGIDAQYSRRARWGATFTFTAVTETGA